MRQMACFVVRILSLIRRCQFRGDWRFDGNGRAGARLRLDLQMSAWTPPNDLRPSGQTLTLDEAVAIANAYLAQWHTDQPLALGEVMQFSNNFYGEAVESDTGQGAFEFLIDPQTGIVVGEPGSTLSLRG